MEPVDHNLWSWPFVGQRVVIERRVEREGHALCVLPVRTGAEDDFSLTLELVVVLQGERDVLGVRVRTPELRRTGHDVTEPAVGVAADQVRARRALVVLDLDHRTSAGR